MKAKEIKEKSKKILVNFVNEIGLDGEYYADNCNCPMVFGNKPLGKFISPNDEELENIIQKLNIDERTKSALKQRGIIVINKKFKDELPDDELYITAVHEIIHSNRDLLIYDAVRDGKNENAYTYLDGKISQNTDEYAETHADASQEILKGSIHVSDEAVKSVKDLANKQSEVNDKTLTKEEQDAKYNKLTEYEQEKIDDSEFEIEEKKLKQYEVDEALVELMALVACRMYKNKEKGIESDVLKTVEKIVKDFEGEQTQHGKSSKIGEVILRHGDFELFKWMLDPIEYSAGEIHYDFFEHYTKNDQDIMKEFYAIEIPLIDRDFGGPTPKKSSNDMEER